MYSCWCHYDSDAIMHHRQLLRSMNEKFFCFPGFAGGASVTGFESE